MVNIIKGNFIFTKNKDAFQKEENKYLVIEDGLVVGFFQDLPEEYKNFDVEDYSDKLIIPSFMDVHVHGAQFANIGLGYDKPLMPWLEAYTFPEENKFKDIDYGKKIYEEFANKLIENGTTRAIVFGTIHLESTKILFDTFKSKGLGGYIGKVNMDRNAPDFLTEDTEQSLEDTKKFLEYANGNDMVKPIITPRFIPTCSNELLEKLGKLALENNIPIQSHLSENKNEIEFVKELHPEDNSYCKAYKKYNMLGDVKTIMAHSVHVEDYEFEMLQNDNLYIAHCPTSNMSLSSGLAPIRKFLDRGIKVGLGSDIAGGYTMSMKEVIVNAMLTSNLYNYYEDENKPLTLSESFYMATKGGGEFFGKVGSFEKGYEFDALVIDDEYKDFSIDERLAKFIYASNVNEIKNVYVKGNKIK